MTATDTTASLPVVRPAAPPDETLTGPDWFRRLVARIDLWVENWIDNHYRGRHRYGVARGTDAQRRSWDGPTGELPVLGGVT